MQIVESIINFLKVMIGGAPKPLPNPLRKKFFHPHCFPTDRKRLPKPKSILEKFNFLDTDAIREREDKNTELVKDIIRTKKLKIVSSGYGLINHIFFTYPNVKERNCQDRFKPVFQDILISLAEVLDDLTITVLAYDAEYVESIIQEIEQKRGDLFSTINIKKPIEIEKDKDKMKGAIVAKIEELSLQTNGLGMAPLEAFIPDTHIEIPQLEKEFSVWAQDPFVVLNSPDPEEKVYFFEPSTFMKNSIDAFVADELEKHYGDTFVLLPPVKQTFNFHGGNILAGEDFLLAGLSAAEGMEKEYKEALAEFFNIDLERVFLIGIRRHDLAHQARQDRIIKLMDNKFYKDHIQSGNDWGVLAQPLFHIDLFITLAGKSETGKERLVISHIVSLFQEAQATVELLNIFLQDIVEYLDALDFFEVHRNPVPLVPMDFINDNNEEERGWYFGLYNNSLVQIGKGTKDQIPQDKIGCIWMPTYGHCYGEEVDWTYLKIFDDANAAIWENLGFMVKRLTDYNAYAFKKGGPHCMLKCLKRVPA